MGEIIERIFIGLAAGAAGGFATFLIQYWWEVKFFFNKNPAKVAHGKWIGKYIQDTTNGTEAEIIPLEITLGTKLNVLSGEIKYQDTNLGCSGGFFDPRILTLHYWTKAEGSRQHGVLVLNLDGSGKIFTGYFLGYSPEDSKLIKGSVEIIKQ
jgi:hypothetical protein